MLTVNWLLVYWLSGKIRKIDELYIVRPPGGGGPLEAGLVAAKHVELLEDLLAGGDLLFFAALGGLFVVLPCAGFGDDQVPVALPLEFAVGFLESIPRRNDDTRHAITPFHVRFWLGRDKVTRIIAKYEFKRVDRGLCYWYIGYWCIGERWKEYNS